jgi:hypothetical protein
MGLQVARPKAEPVVRLLSTLVAIAVLSGSSLARAPNEPGRTDFDGNSVLEGPVLPGSTARGSAQPRGTPGLFSDQAAFLAAAGVVTTESFEDDFTTADCDSGALTLITFNDFTATSDIPALKLLDRNCFGNHNTTPQGLKYLGADTDVSGVSAAVEFDFAQPLMVFGLFLIDLDFAVLEITVNGVNYPVVPNGDGGESYFGIVSPDPFTNVRFQIVTAFDAHYSFDDIAYGPAGPSAWSPATSGAGGEGSRRTTATEVAPR